MSEEYDDPSIVIEWLQERRDNCIRLGALTTGKNLEEWMSDASFFSAAIRLIARSGSGLIV